VQVDDADLGGEFVGGTVGRRSENTVPFIGAVSQDQLQRGLSPLRFRQVRRA
jgi:hypothetical protein